MVSITVVHKIYHEDTQLIPPLFSHRVSRQRTQQKYAIQRALRLLLRPLSAETANLIPHLPPSNLPSTLKTAYKLPPSKPPTIHLSVHDRLHYIFASFYRLCVGVQNRENNLIRVSLSFFLYVFCANSFVGG